MFDDEQIKKWLSEIKMPRTPYTNAFYKAASPVTTTTVENLTPISFSENSEPATETKTEPKLSL